VALWVTVFMIAAIFGKQLTINCLRDAITYFDLNQQSSSIRRMYVAVPQMSAGEVLSAFHRDAPYLFLGAAFVAVGLVSAAFAVIRRKHDLLLIYFALFAVFYGLRLWIQATLLGITVQGSAFYTRLRSGIDYIILFPHSCSSVRWAYRHKLIGQLHTRELSSVQSLRLALSSLGRRQRTA
jgi:hypothetical protein